MILVKVFNNKAMGPFEILGEWDHCSGCGNPRMRIRDIKTNEIHVLFDEDVDKFYEGKGWNKSLEELENES